MSGQDGPVWITVPEAARRLGVAPDTMRKRAARGHVEARKQTVNGVGQWFIRADSLGLSGQPHTGDTGTPASGLDGPDMAALMGEVLAELRAIRVALERPPEPPAPLALPEPPAPVRTEPVYPWWHWRRWV